MTIVLMDYLLRLQATPLLIYHKLARSLHLSITKTQLTLTFLSVLLLGGSFATYRLQSSLLATKTSTDYACSWHIVTVSDTLTLIAKQYHTTISTLIHTNGIHNFNLIFVGQRLCILHSQGQDSSSEGVQPDGTVNWYDYQALDWSKRAQVHDLLCQVSAKYHLPPKLLLAIAWQESGWTQHVIAWDGGVGVMQLMPYTATSINHNTNQRLNPYKLSDNINLGAIYLQWLWQGFHGNLPEVISAYNEGGWAVKHQGVLNSHYVNNVLALMKKLE